MSIGDETLDIEITRLMEGLVDQRMIRYGRTKFDPDDTDMIVETIENSQLSECELRRAVSNSIEAKTAKKKQFGGSNDCVLIITNELFPVMEPWFRIWDDNDYSEFTAVFLATLISRMKSFSFIGCIRRASRPN